MKPRYLILIPDITDKGGIGVLNIAFLKDFICSLQNACFSVIIFNQRFSDAVQLLPIDRFKNNTSVFCCGSKFSFIKKIKFITLFLFISIFKNPKLIVSAHINLLKFYPFIYPVFKIPYALITYGIEIWNLNYLEKAIVKNAKFICPIGNHTASRIRDQVQVKGRFFIIYPQVDEKRFLPEPKDQKLLKMYDLVDKKVILTVCRLDVREKYKGYDRVIEALPKIVSDVSKIKYLIVGGGNDLSRIKTLIQKKGLENNVVLCGSVPGSELNKFYNLCDVFIMPSKREGFGIVFIEALACGKPVIAGNRDGSREALLGGELGIMVDPDDVNEIAEAVTKVLRKGVAERLLDGEYLRTRVVQEYGLDRFRERIAIFSRLLTS